MNLKKCPWNMAGTTADLSIAARSVAHDLVAPHTVAASEQRGAGQCCVAKKSISMPFWRDKATRSLNVQAKYGTFA
jgi:hypothetical protein